MSLFLLDRRASPDLFNLAVDALLDFADGALDEDGFLSTLAAYQRAERERFGRLLSESA